MESPVGTAEGEAVSLWAAFVLDVIEDLLRAMVKALSALVWWWNQYGS